MTETPDPRNAPESATPESTAPGDQPISDRPAQPPPPDAGDPDQLRSVSGTVKWFDPRKGFGFVVGPQGQDIFVHYTVIEGDGFRALKDGCTVEYDAERSDKGWRATRVIRDDTAEVVVPRRTHARTSRQ